MKARLLATLRPLWRPSLLRRVLAALLAAFALVGVALLAMDFMEFKAAMASRPGVQTIAEDVAATIAGLKDADAVAVVRAGAAQLNGRRRKSELALQDVEFQLRRRDTGGAASPDTRTSAIGTAATAITAGAVFATSRIRDADLRPGPTPGAVVTVDGASFWMGQAEAGPWRVTVAEPRLGDGAVLAWLGRDLLKSMLLAFPLVVLPLWIAVRRGMRPLTALAREVESRDPQDLAPLGFRPRHDELLPLVAAYDRLLERVRGQLRRERAFVQDAAHELRTPMAVVAVQAHVLAQARDEEERLAAARSLDQALARAAHLSRQLLALADVDEGRAAVAEAFDLAELVQARLAHAALKAEEDGLELSLQAPDSLPVRADRLAVESVIGNLVENALRYTPRGGQVAVQIEADGGEVELTVADDGPGIAADQRARAFERFWRGDQAGRIGGTGLGLAIVREAARRLGGQVTLADGLGTAPGSPGLSASVRWPMATKGV